MSFSKEGIRSIALANIDTLLSSAVYPYAPGIRTPAMLKITGYNEPTDFRERKLRNMLNANLEVTALQSRIDTGNLKTLALLAYYALQGGVDVQMIGMESTLGTGKYSGDIYSFTGVSNFMGLDFEFSLSPKGREVKIILEVAKAYADIRAIIEAGETAESCDTINALAVVGYAGYDFGKIEMPVLRSVDSPLSTPLINIQDVDDWELTFKTKGNKSAATNRTNVNYVTCTFDVTLKNASNDFLIDIANKSQYLNLAVGIDSGTKAEIYDFAAGVLSNSKEIAIGDNERTTKLMFTGDIPIKDFTTFVNNPVNDKVSFIL